MTSTTREAESAAADDTAHLSLSDAHLKMLRDESGIADEIIAARGYRTITNHKELTRLGFASRQLQPPGLLLPLHGTDGTQPLMIFRPDHPRAGKDERIIKYEIPANTGVRLDCPPVCRGLLADPSVPLWTTEGIKKGDALASRGACAVALLGVWNFRGKNPFGGTTFLADWDYIALKGRDVRIVFDNDLMQKPDVRKALERLTEHLQRKGAHVRAVYLPLDDGEKIGVDDYLVAGHTLTDLEVLLEGPRPQPSAAPPVSALLDEAPLTMRRPLALIKGTAYAAIWPFVRVTTRETTDKNGAIVKLDPPRMRTEQRLLIVRSDGQIFGDVVPLSELGLEVALPETPPTEKLWSTPAVKRYREGIRPNPHDVFMRIMETVDTFIDFDRSLADQRAMCEMIACYVLATWFLDAFTVIGFLWPNGERGSGKTQLLLVVTELAYLGQTILAGGSFASLRDLADYGACLAFDDAENLADPKRTDPDKRTLLLAGNRRGSTVPLKEPGPDRTWKTRYVNAFCPRLFSAIRLPDPVLASRSIITPLIRTPDRRKANADPLDFKLWPHGRRALLDDLWALALTHLAALPAYERRVNEQSTLAGRTLEPWRALLAVAHWLDDHGVEGLQKRMLALSLSYQQERVDMESSDLTALTIRALCDCAIRAVSAMRAMNMETPREWSFAVKEVAEAARTLATDEDLNLDPEKITSRRIGRILGKMRLKQGARTGGKGSRLWDVTVTDLTRWTELYAIPFPETLRTNGTHGFNGTHGTDRGDGCQPFDSEETQSWGQEKTAWETEL